MISSVFVQKLFFGWGEMRRDDTTGLYFFLVYEQDEKSVLPAACAVNINISIPLEVLRF
jgi:hypothetical protein